MNRDDVIRMAREAGFTVGYGSPALEKHERFAQLVAAQAAMVEREGCWQAVRAEHLTDSQKTEGDIAYDMAIEHAAAAIRARGNA